MRLAAWVAFFGICAVVFLLTRIFVRVGLGPFSLIAAIAVFHSATALAIRVSEGRWDWHWTTGLLKGMVGRPR